ncbi:hypothetical protein Nepgr_008502 [Nepenthes gracilis]|uniref:Ubiquitin carboxyl-terminal hydrolase n=1 Tax=Nepenthes gracilis TaxID=150966 RepID=A0AAD3S9M7_NEPGR|nr:hypothetical protein Nepgr_008502 [Nepenthes gracilis]
MKITVFSNRMKIRGEINFHSLLRNFRRGLQILLSIRLIPVPRAHLSAASLLVFAVFIFFLRDGRMGNFNSLLWSSEGSRSSEELFVPGLTNLGNNCFLNVILQALASCISFKLFLEENNEELQSSFVQEHVKGLPLCVALAKLLEELCILQDGRVILSPREVMSAMNLYIPQFKLANQQDAAEAFLHLLSCIREEFSDSYVPKCSTLAEMAGPSGRIIAPTRGGEISEPERWRQQFIGPFDGIISSFLTCQSCSSEIMMDFEFFHTLALSPMTDDSDYIVDGCAVEDCIRSFLAADRVENYYCSHCWHISAIKYLSSVEGNKKEIEKLSCCNEQDCCDCRNLPFLQALTWSNRFSHTFKQLSIARCPKILCLQLQRASVNVFGELVKLEGHISFPFLLNLSPFVDDGLGIRNWEENMQRSQAKQQYQLSTSHSNHFDMLRDRRYLNLISERRLDCAELVKFDKSMQAFQKLGFPPNQICHDKAACHLKPPEDKIYRLVSVVEHFGRTGSGHYVVYRGVRTGSDGGNDIGQNNVPSLRWFCISDSEVQPASEKDVLAADATLLFYEKIAEA